MSIVVFVYSPAGVSVAILLATEVEVFYEKPRPNIASLKSWVLLYTAEAHITIHRIKRN